MAKVEGFEFKRGKTGCLLIHGFGGSPLELKWLRERLAENGYSVFAPLLPGHGTSPHDMLKTGWRDWHHAAEESLNSLKRICDKVFVIGLSMGGAMGISLASDNSLSGVVSLAAPLIIKDWRIRFLPILRYILKYYKGVPLDLKDISKREEIFSYEKVPVRCIEELLTFLKELKEKLPDVHIPVLLMHGKVDHVVHPENAELIYNLLGSQDKRLMYLDNSYHILTIDYDRGIVRDEVLKFISGILKQQ